MKNFRLQRIYEWLDVPDVEIDQEFAEWCYYFYASESFRFKALKEGMPKLSKKLIEASKKFVKENSDGYLYRGISLSEEEYEQLKKEKALKTKYVPASWTMDKETARAFAYPYEGVGILMRCPIIEFKKFFAMDLVMYNVDQKKMKEILPKEITEYSYISESEIVSFDRDIIVPIKNIVIVKKQKDDLR